MEEQFMQLTMCIEYTQYVYIYFALETSNSTIYTANKYLNPISMKWSN
jgi:hypothetical protein